ncbi:MAG: molybdopterin-dependent oxidoreductase [Clostridiales Family XIII bacterium]|jgi:anaerobic selenocysteine-containing dehydrogenase|nr:molybdopterin-dependent oxidoreductase [Clostridiales Family XIII bacterium]
MRIEYDEVVTTTTWSAGPGCHGGCGAKLYVKDGKVVKVEGDENHPWNWGRGCSRLLALTQYMYHPDRILYPLKRVGPRGDGNFERISWDEAYDLIEEKFNKIKENYGAKAVIFIQGTGRDIGGPMSLVAYNYGSPNWSQLGLGGQACYGPRLGAMSCIQGDTSVADCSQFFEKRFDDPRYRLPRYIMVWGQDPTRGCPDGFYGNWVIDCMKRGSKLIVVDPRQNFLTSRAEHHLQLRPGTDGALALGMINAIIENGWYNKEFVEKWCLGFEDLAERAREYPLEKVASITWVPKESILAAAKAYALASPGSAVQWGLPIDQAPDGVIVAQAVNDLWAITGNIDVPGGNVIARNAYHVSAYPFDNYQLADMYGDDFVEQVVQKRIGSDEYGWLRKWRCYIQPDIAVQQMLTQNPYPIKATWIQTANPVANAADMKLHYEALRAMEFNVVIDLFHNPTTMSVADVILPAATFAERTGFRAWFQPVQIIRPAVTVGECRNDWEIAMDMAQRFNPELKKRYPNGIKDYMDWRLEPTGMTYADLLARGGWKWGDEEGSAWVPYKRYERGALRADGKPGFRTPSGKVELKSSQNADWGATGLTKVDPLPYYQEPFESEMSTPELFKKYPLVMITGRRSAVFFHSEHRNIPWLRECDPYPDVEIHPSVARDMKLENGEWVWIENERGRIRRKVKINAGIHPKTVSVLHGWWLPETEGRSPNLFSAWDVNCNVLMPIGAQSRTGYGGNAYKTTLVRLVKMSDGSPAQPPVAVWGRR